MSKTKYYIGGTFDCLHSGHINLFRNVRNSDFEGEVIVAVNRDEFAERYKRKPIIPLHERIAVLRAIKHIDTVVVNEGDEDSSITIKKIKPNYIVHGDDWTGESLMKQMGLTEEFLKKYNIKFKYFPYTEGISTSTIVNEILHK